MIAAIQAPIAPGYVEARTGRVAILAKEYAESDCNGDVPAYWFDPESDSMGLDPWRVIDGVDLPINGTSMDVWFESGKPITVGPLAVFFVSPAHAAKIADGAHLRMLRDEENKEFERREQVKADVLQVLGPLGFQDAQDGEYPDDIYHPLLGSFSAKAVSLATVVEIAFRAGQESGRREIQSGLRKLLDVSPSSEVGN